MKEKLECARCEQKWERERARGRKPIFCPECTEINAQEENEPDNNPIAKVIKTVEDSNKTYKFYIPAPSNWICDHCDATLKVNVGVIEVPMHVCVKRRSMSFPFIQKVRQDAKYLSIGSQS
jgi:ribosomal protein L37AE/L43A